MNPRKINPKVSISALSLGKDYPELTQDEKELVDDEIKEMASDVNYCTTVMLAALTSTSKQAKDAVGYINEIAKSNPELYKNLSVAAMKFVQGMEASSAQQKSSRPIEDPQKQMILDLFAKDSVKVDIIKSEDQARLTFNNLSTYDAAQKHLGDYVNKVHFQGKKGNSFLLLLDTKDLFEKLKDKSFSADISKSIKQSGREKKVLSDDKEKSEFQFKK